MLPDYTRETEIKIQNICRKRQAAFGGDPRDQYRSCDQLPELTAVTSTDALAFFTLASACLEKGSAGIAFMLPFEVVELKLFFWGPGARG